MNIENAKDFVYENARPIEMALYRFFFQNAPAAEVTAELAKYQNPDGGFGNGLEADCWNPASSPITTNDALITLFRVNALDPDSDMVRGMVKYLASHDGFDEEKRRWLFAIESNREYPHAIWWEKEGDGISRFNPTVSLAAFMTCFADKTDYYAGIVREGFDWLRKGEETSGDDLKCFMLARGLLERSGVTNVIDLDAAKALICERLEGSICPDTSKYGREYVPVPSDFFAGMYSEYVTDAMRPLIAAEKSVLGELQKDDGGFDITWQWYTPYPEFEQARLRWRPRLTLDKLLFFLAEQ